MTQECNLRLSDQQVQGNASQVLASYYSLNFSLMLSFLSPSASEVVARKYLHLYHQTFIDHRGDILCVLLTWLDAKQRLLSLSWFLQGIHV